MKKSVMSLLMVLLLGVLVGCGAKKSDDASANEKKYIIRSGIGLNDQSVQFKSLEMFKEIVERESNGRIEVELYHSSQLGDDVEMMEALKLGTQQMTCPSTAPIGGFINDFKVFELPFLFPSGEAADYVLDGEVGQGILKKLESEGIVGLTYWENGFRNLTNSSREVRTPEDMVGLKVRTMPNPIHLSAFRAMGANPTPMNFGELFSAMQQGVVDGQENPWGTIYSQNFFEVQGYATDTGHIYSPFVLMISKKFLDTLPEDLKAVVFDAAQESKTYNRELNRKTELELRDSLKDKLTLTLLSSDEKKAFQEKVLPVYKEFEGDIGADLINSVLAELKAFEKNN